MLNQIFLMGRLTRDPELRYTQSNTPVASFTLAVDDDFKSESGERKTTFIDCVAWRSTGEFASKYFSKGRAAVVSGKLSIRDWTDKDGNKRKSAEVIVSSMYFADSKRDSESFSGSAHAYQTAVPQAVSAEGFTELTDDYEDGELPF